MIAHELHKQAHNHYMNLGYVLDGKSFTMDDRDGLEEAIISAFLSYVELEG